MDVVGVGVSVGVGVGVDVGTLFIVLFYEQPIDSEKCRVSLQECHIWNTGPSDVALKGVPKTISHIYIYSCVRIGEPCVLCVRKKVRALSLCKLKPTAQLL